MSAYASTEDTSADTLIIQLGGHWTMKSDLPVWTKMRDHLSGDPSVQSVKFETSKLDGWDSCLLTYLLSLLEYCEKKHIEIVEEGLPVGVQRLLKLATAVSEREGARRHQERVSFLAMVGTAGQDLAHSATNMLAFLGESFSTFLLMLRGKARFRWGDLAQTIQECGAQALPIVTLISLLIGMILAFVGAIQLSMFGAQIYLADLVGIGMSREMGAMMVGIIMAGRTGAAFAAQLGTMQVNGEIDAFQTFGISPMEFLVLPRMLALALMMPLLCIYADLMGIIGGMIVGVGMCGLTIPEYYHETVSALGLDDFGVGIFKSIVFGILVALSGCMCGIQSGRSASAVGDAATSAVVTGIVLIIVSDSMITILTTLLHI